MDDHERRVRERAYRIWEEEGRPNGRADTHWEMARELVAIEQNQARQPNRSGATRTTRRSRPTR